MVHAPTDTARTPPASAPKTFSDAKAAVAHLIALYDEATQFLCEEFKSAMSPHGPSGRVRAFYPEIRLTTTSFAKIDSRLSFGHLAEPGTYATTCLLYTSPSPRDLSTSRMPSSA